MKRILGAVVLVLLTSGCGPQPAGSSTPTAAASASASASSEPSADLSEPPSPTAGVASLSFERVFAIDGAELSSIVSVPGGFMAGGCRIAELGCTSALLLRSADGRSWSEVALPGAEGRRITTVAATPFGLLALGATATDTPPAHRAGWRSVDGLTWEPLTIPADDTIVFEQVVILPDRTVFLGADYAYDLVVSDIAWATADGSSWTSGTTPIRGIVAAQPGLVAIGDDCVDVCPVAENRVSRSHDGFMWTDETIPPEMAGMAVTTLAALDGRAIVGGISGNEAAATLWRDEATGWHMLQFADGAGYSVASVLVAAGRVLVLARSELGGPVKGWLSADSETFRPVEDDGLGDRFIVGSAGGGPLVLLVDYREIWIATF